MKMKPYEESEANVHIQQIFSIQTSGLFQGRTNDFDDHSLHVYVRLVHRVEAYIKLTNLKFATDALLKRRAQQMKNIVITLNKANEDASQ